MLKIIIDSLDDVDEKYRELYKQEGEKFVLQLGEDVKNHPRVTALHNAYRREQEDRRKAREAVDALALKYEGLPEDFDAVAYNALKAKAEGKTDTKVEEQIAEAVQRAKDALTAKHAAELKTRDDRIVQLDGTIRKRTIDEGLTVALAEAGVSKELLPAAKALLKEKGKVKLEEKDGDFSAVVDSDLGPVPLSQFVKDWTNGDEGKIFVAKAAGGDAKPGDNKAGGGENPFDSKTRNLTKQQELIKADPAKAKRLAEQAGITPNW